ncbi:uncharacterized protein LOC129770559 isoform X2 [Toxorhynchites rutilus septentrionalis]|uniref:uncharacterized protein LOC129770559 isoform X2 n=1 Tax=Toxorhynchites rutilus septentrionalis TaxID=329112 RepID=UPI002478F8F5|nr:uncharacterized protein LOC129770559 isoform X2 [Toxorhynchites rutilus septentrionalis]
MARNKKTKRCVSLRKTPRKSVHQALKITKPRLIEISEITTKKRKSSQFKKKVQQQKRLRDHLLQERKKLNNNLHSQLLYPPIPPPVPSESSSSRSASRRKVQVMRSVTPLQNDPIVIDSEDDSNLPETPLFYVDKTGGFNEKQVPLYESSHCGLNDTVMTLDSTLEEGEIKDGTVVSFLNKALNDEEIRILDEEEDCEDNVPSAPAQTDVDDQSVIFCSEIIDLDRDNVKKPLEFIPIGFDYIKPKGKKRVPKKAGRNLDEGESSSQPEPAETQEDGDKRMVVIDGNNVAFGHLQGKNFSVKGLSICIQYFKKLGHEVKAVVPQFRLKKEKSSDQKLLEELYRRGDVLLAPSKNLPGQWSSSYDDRLILSVAEKFDGVIISNDNFRDLLAESDSWKKIIETRVIGYTWAMDAFFVPDDPYGRHGPKLKDLLERKPSEASKENSP